MPEKELEKDKRFQTDSSTNALSGVFDAYNGDFDTAEEYIRAYIKNDRRALEKLDVQNMDELFAAVERLYPDIAAKMREKVITPDVVKACLDTLPKDGGSGGG